MSVELLMLSYEFQHLHLVCGFCEAQDSVAQLFVLNVASRGLDPSVLIALLLLRSTDLADVVL